jgi:hypothetical protein
MMPSFYGYFQHLNWLTVTYWKGAIYLCDTNCKSAYAGSIPARTSNFFDTFNDATTPQTSV